MHADLGVAQFAIPRIARMCKASSPGVSACVARSAVLGALLSNARPLRVDELPREASFEPGFQIGKLKVFLRVAISVFQKFLQPLLISRIARVAVRPLELIRTDVAGNQASDL